MKQPEPAKVQSAHLPDAVPSPYTPACPAASWPVRQLWFFTALGRAVRVLWRAIRESEDNGWAAELGRRLPGLLKDGKNVGPRRWQRVRDMLLFLAWSALQRKDWAEAMRWLGKLDQWAPRDPARLALRWGLLELLPRDRHGSDYLAQAKLFLGDQLAAGFGTAVLAVLGDGYGLCELQQRKGFAAGVHASLAADDRVRAGLAVCECPPLFGSAEEARAWEGRLQPGQLGYSPLMKADACLALGRVAEWVHEWDAMAARAEEALTAKPRHPGALFLGTRAALQRPGGAVPAGWQDDTPDEPAWRLLRLQCAARERGGLEQASALVESLPLALDGGDLLALDLTVKLLEEILTRPEVRTMEGIGRCAELSVRLGEHAASVLPALPFFQRSCVHCGREFRFARAASGRSAGCPHCGQAMALEAPRNAAEWLPWTEVNLALADIHLRADHNAAVDRLENTSLTAYQPARLPNRVARLLAGSPKAEGRGTAPHPALDALEDALRLVCGPVAEHGGVPAALTRRIRAVVSDPLAREFPALGAVAAVLAAALDLAADPQGTRQLMIDRVEGKLPAWAGWLLSRLQEIASNQEAVRSAGSRLDGVSGLGAGTAWFVELWWSAYGMEGQPVPAVAVRAGEVLDLALPPELGQLTATLRALRRGRYRGGKVLAEEFVAAAGMLGLGDLCGAHFAAELEVERRYARGRCLLSEADPAAAAREFEGASTAAAGISRISALWWRPLLTYWLGVGHATAGSGEARGLLESLAGGVMADRARGQLALLDLRDGDAAAAARRLEGACDRIAGVRYAKALLLERTGQREASLRLLGDAETRQVLAGSSYEVAAWRLSAAIAARCGHVEEAVRLQRELLADHPADEATVLRLAWRELQGAYEACRAGGGPAARECGAVLDGFTPRSRVAKEQVGACLWLRDFLRTSSIRELAASLDTRIPWTERRAVWRLLLASGLLHAGDPAAARAALALDQGPVPPAVERARLLLETWDGLLQGAQHPGESDGAAARLEELGAALRRHEDGDPLVSTWRQLAENGAALCRGKELGSDRWRALDGSAMAHVPFLFDEDAATRRAAAEALWPALENGRASWDEDTRLLLGALAAWAMERDDQYLEHYLMLEPILDDLPVPGRDLWVAGALVRFMRQEWSSLDGKSLPDCVADMSDPLVALIVGLADARAVGGQIKRPNHQVADNVRRARANLMELLQKPDLPGQAVPAPGLAVAPGGPSNH